MPREESTLGLVASHAYALSELTGGRLFLTRVESGMHLLEPATLLVFILSKTTTATQVNMVMYVLFQEITALNSNSHVLRKLVEGDQNALDKLGNGEIDPKRELELATKKIDNLLRGVRFVMTFIEELMLKTQIQPVHVSWLWQGIYQVYCVLEQQIIETVQRLETSEHLPKNIDLTIDFKTFFEHVLVLKQSFTALQALVSQIPGVVAASFLEANTFGVQPSPQDSLPDTES